jgi:hypothetical protein
LNRRIHLGHLLALVALALPAACNLGGPKPEKQYKEAWSQHTAAMERDYPRGTPRVRMELDQPGLKDYPAFDSTANPFLQQARADCEAEGRGQVFSAQTRLVRRPDGELWRDYVFYDVQGRVLRAYREDLA